MSFSFRVDGHAGADMEGNSEEEINAVKELIAETLNKAKSINLNLTISQIQPLDWAPDKLTTFEG